MKIVNLTPHEVRVVLPDGTTREFPPSGRVARVATRQVAGDPIDGVPVVTTEYGQVEGVPAPEPGTIYMVPMLVGQHLAGQRDDIFGPDSGPTAIRGKNGQIEAVRALVKF